LRRIWFSLLAAAVIFVVSLVGIGVPAWGTSAEACTSSAGSGTMCNKILGTGLQVNDIVALFTLPSPDYLTRATWDFELTTYTCDPRGKTKPQCRPDMTRRGPSRVGSPPASGCSIVVRSATGQVIGSRPCPSPIVGSAYAFMGELGVRVPWTLGAKRWLCVEISRLVNGRWIDNATTNPRGDRACNNVHA
jgi:hypothetical protein